LVLRPQLKILTSTDGHFGLSKASEKVTIPVAKMKIPKIIEESQATPYSISIRAKIESGTEIPKEININHEYAVFPQAVLRNQDVNVLKYIMYVPRG
jgi:hypothetical protein